MKSKRKCEHFTVYLSISVFLWIEFSSIAHEKHSTEKARSVATLSEEKARYYENLHTVHTTTTSHVERLGAGSFQSTVFYRRTLCGKLAYDVARSKNVFLRLVFS